jgi:hypothetical protein
VSDVVAVLLADHDVARQRHRVGKPDEHLVDQLGGTHRIRSGPLEQVEVLPIAAAKQVTDRRHRGLSFVKDL